MDTNETFAVDHSALKHAQMEDDDQDDCWVEQRKNLGTVFAAAVSKSSTANKKAAMEVFVRVRPTTHPPSEELRIVKPEQDGERNAPQHPTKIQTSSKHFEFTGIFTPSCSQEDVYLSTLKGYVEGLRSGKSALVFCYGRTNTGKTHTVTGTLEHTDQWGLLPRALQDLLPSTISYFEIYNEQVFDLLGNVNSANQTTSTKPLGPLLRNVSAHAVDTMDVAMSYIRSAHQARRSASNNVNARSSRSHALCRLQLPNGAVLWIVDLAGSEKATPGMRLKESIYINRSLSALNRCFLALKNQKPLPYRDSKLTHILGQHWKSGHGYRTTLIVNLTLDDASAASQVLEYASIAAKAQSVASARPNSTASRAVAYDLNGRRRIVQSIKQVVQMLSPRRNATATTSVQPYSVTKSTTTGDNVRTVIRRREIGSDLSDDDDHSSPGDKKRIEDMMEVVQDCEEEMDRLRESHIIEIDHLKNEFETRLQAEKDAAAGEKERLEAALASREGELESHLDTISDLEATVARSKLEHELTRDELDRKEAQVLELQQQLDTVTQELAESRSMQQNKHSAEGQHDDSKALMSQGKENAGGPASNADVARVSLAADVPKISDDENEQLDSLAILKPPARKVRCDPFTGKYLRPRGRAPSGALGWDEDRGAWRMSIA